MKMKDNKTNFFYDCISILLVILWVMLILVLTLSGLFEDNWFNAIFLTLSLFIGIYGINYFIEDLKPKWKNGTNS